MKLNMPSVLMISLATEIFSNKFCDTFKRHCDYAKKLKKLIMIVYTPRSMDAKPIFYKNLFIYPTNSRTRIHFLFDIIIIFFKLKRKYKIDVISTQDPFITGLAGVIIKILFKIPLDIQNHSDFIDNKKWIFENFPRNSCLNILAKWMIQFGNSHRVLNRSEKSKYISYGIIPSIINIITTPVNDRFLNDSGFSKELRKELLPLNKDFLIFWVGRCVKFKNIPMLLYSFRNLLKFRKNAFLLIAGNGKEKEKWMRLAHKLNLLNDIKFIDNISHELLSDYYKASDVYVHSSYYEGYGKTMVESILCKTPVIANISNGAKEIIEHKITGFLVKHNSIKSMRKTIEFVMDNKDFCKKMSNNAQKIIREKYNRDKIIDRICDSFKQCASSSYKYWE